MNDRHVDLEKCIDKTMPCNCIPAYKDRGLSAPDCPNCNFAIELAEAIWEWHAKQVGELSRELGTMDAKFESRLEPLRKVWEELRHHKFSEEFNTYDQVMMWNAICEVLDEK